MNRQKIQFGKNKTKQNKTKTATSLVGVRGERKPGS